MTNSRTNQTERISGEDIEILARPSSVDPKSFHFYASVPIYDGFAFFSAAADANKYSPLASALLEVEGAQTVIIKNNFVKVTGKDIGDAEQFIKKIQDVMRKQLKSVAEPVYEAYASADKSHFPDDIKIQEKVGIILEEEINPGLAMHGGFVNLVDVKDGRVFMEFGGGCHGCMHVRVTLKEGVEKRIKEKLPEVKEVLDTTNHGGGRTPFFM